MDCTYKEVAVLGKTELLKRKATINGWLKRHGNPLADSKEKVEVEMAGRSVLCPNETNALMSNIYQQNLIDIDVMLAKVADGSFKNCSDCGNPIPIERLATITEPGTNSLPLRCNSCQQAYAALNNRKMRPAIGYTLPAHTHRVPATKVSRAPIF